MDRYEDEPLSTQPHPTSWTVGTYLDGTAAVIRHSPPIAHLLITGPEESRQDALRAMETQFIVSPEPINIWFARTNPQAAPGFELPVQVEQVLGLDDNMADTAGRLCHYMNQRYDLYNQAGILGIDDARHDGQPDLPVSYLAVVFDGYPTCPSSEFTTDLTEVAHKGGRAGIFLVISVDDPEVVPAAIRLQTQHLNLGKGTFDGTPLITL